MFDLNLCFDMLFFILICRIYIMKTVNFFGGPCAGKSTAAAGLFYEMKKHWIEAEYIQEYAKELVWSNSMHMLSEQNYIFAEQEHRLHRLNEKIEVAISDSPLLLSSFYAPQVYFDSFHQSVFDFFHMYDNLNIFVQRSHEYSLQGRLQDEKDADHIAQEMQLFLQNNGIPYWSITASNTSPHRLLRWLIEDIGIKLPDGIDLELKLQKDITPENWLKFHPSTTLWKSGNLIHRANLKNILTVGKAQS